MWGALCDVDWHLPAADMLIVVIVVVVLGNVLLSLPWLTSRYYTSLDCTALLIRHKTEQSILCCMIALKIRSMCPSLKPSLIAYWDTISLNGTQIQQVRQRSI